MVEQKPRSMEAILADVKTRCGNKLIALGFHKAAGLTPEEYMNSFPSFVNPNADSETREAWRAGCRVPVLVDNTISPKIYCALLDIKDPLNVLGQLEDSEFEGRDTRWFMRPQEMGKGGLPQRLEENSRSEIRVQGNLTDIFSVLAQYPNLFLGAVSFAAGSFIKGDSDLVPYLAYPDSNQRPQLGFASRSKPLIRFSDQRLRPGG